MQTGFYILVFGKLAFYKNKMKKTDNSNGVSVIICARNEAQNLQNNLPHILKQDYQNYEVIVVNDGSTDKTEEILSEYKKLYQNFRFISISQEEKSGAGKKYILTKGIHEAKNEIVLLTDSDCVPSSKYWIQNMQSHFNDGKSIAIGYSPYKDKKSLLNLFIRYETFYTALQYLSLALNRSPYMGVGRNLAYRKSLFIKNNGFESHKNISSGDDDLFVNETADSENTVIEIRPDSFIISEPKNDFRSWFAQKKRHITTGSHYKENHKLILGLLFLSHCLFYYSFITLLIMNVFKIEFILGIFAIRIIIQLSIFKLVMSKLKENTIIWVFSPLLDFLYLSYLLILMISNLFIKQVAWK